MSPTVFMSIRGPLFLASFVLVVLFVLNCILVLWGADPRIVLRRLYVKKRYALVVIMVLALSIMSLDSAYSNQFEYFLPELSRADLVGEWRGRRIGLVDDNA